MCTHAHKNKTACAFLPGGMRYHLLSLEDREDLGESSRPRRKKHDYRIALFGGSQPQSCRYFNPKVPWGSTCKQIVPTGAVQSVNVV